MNDTSKAWLPAGKLDEIQRMILSVPTNSKPAPDLYRSLLESKLQALVDADPAAATQALEMSQEQAPELWAISEQTPVNQWGSALMRSEGMSRLLSAIDWTLPGSLKAHEPLSLPEIAEMIA